MYGGLIRSGVCPPVRRLLGGRHAEAVLDAFSPISTVHPAIQDVLVIDLQHTALTPEHQGANPELFWQGAASVPVPLGGGRRIF